ncbi:MAG: hypothetical protein J0J01_03005 [Reyranella sp.]|nr:hypothetical protein [Reyranella sp.]
MTLSRRSLLAGTAALGLPPVAWAQEKVVRYGIPMTDIPLTTGQPDRGAKQDALAAQIHARAVDDAAMV